jgi:histidine triad (HIT) family protein
MARDPNCVFCKIASGEIPSIRIAETSLACAFMDIAPIATGHTLVIPRDHYENLGAMPPAIAAALHELAAQIAPVLQKSVGAEGLNVLQNNGRVAGQVVMHVHVHLIPRRQGDGLHWPWPAKKAETGELERLARDVRAHLPGS